MLDLRPILFITGILMIPLGISMLVPVAVDLSMHNRDWAVFLASSVFTCFVGGALAVTNRGISESLELKQAFLLTTFLWMILPLFSAIPFMVSDLHLSFTDAYFEAMSGLTTTGSTVITGLDTAPPGILMWRALLQWLGGVGIIVTAVAVLPMLRIGGMQLFRMESSDTSEKILPRATQISGGIAGMYIGLSLLCFGGLVFAGMGPFDAAAHAMTTIATGGFSTSDMSVGKFNSAQIEFIIMIFMVIGSLPFVLFLQVVRGRPLALWRDSQVRAFIAIITLFTILMVLWLMFMDHYEGLYSFRYAAFNVISVISGTGFSNADYGIWGTFAGGLLFAGMFIGGCAGSASCGIKVFRLQVLFETLKVHIQTMNRPHGVFRARFNGTVITPNVISSVMSFLFLYFLIYLMISLAVALTGVDMLTALSGTATTLSNVGPGLGSVIGPMGTFQTVPDSAKWLFSLAMLLGRLELFTVLVLFTPSFWRA